MLMLPLLLKQKDQNHLVHHVLRILEEEIFQNEVVTVEERSLIQRIIKDFLEVVRIVEILAEENNI